MNKDNKFFLELKENNDAKWVVSFLEKWEEVWHNVLQPEMEIYINDQENMERLIYEAWKHYCAEDTKKIMKLEIDGFETIPLIKCRVLSTIPQYPSYSYEEQEVTDIKCCGLCVSLEFAKESQIINEYMTELILKRETIKGWIVKDSNRIPVDIHGGNVGKCYFGYINPTIFD